MDTKNRQCEEAGQRYTHNPDSPKAFIARISMQSLVAATKKGAHEERGMFVRFCRFQEGCCLAFSIAMPLLGKRHRKHVYRCFTVAAQVLEDLESPLVRLRTQLHFEVSSVSYLAGIVRSICAFCTSSGCGKRGGVH